MAKPYHLPPGRKSTIRAYSDAMLADRIAGLSIAVTWLSAYDAAQLDYMRAVVAARRNATVTDPLYRGMPL